MNSPNLMRRKFFFLSVAIFSLSDFAAANQVVENFFTAQRKDATQTTAVWNIALGMIHPPLTVDYTTGGADVENQVVDVGDGSDGSFDPTTYAHFSVNGVTPGNVITIDTTTRTAFSFTNFYLASGWTIEGSGPNPLWFKVQGTFTNNGTIDCSGYAGGSVTSNIFSQSSGGLGRCGGGNGGAGGASGLTAGTGTSGGTGTTGGVGSANTFAAGTYATGGGGGGGFNTVSPSTNGGPALSGGAGGTSFADDHILHFASTNGPGGGSGGGGGGAYLFLDAYQSAGGGGGGGGGVIRISSVGAFTNTGSILAMGGNGGGASFAAGAGSGGAGSGGTVWVQTTGVYTDSGVINATHGAIGGVTAPGTGTGGVGCIGRTWFTTSDGNYNVTGSEAPSTNLGDLGVIHYSKNPYTAQSLTYDLQNTGPTNLAVTLTTSLPSTSSASLQIAGSSDGFQNDNTGFVATSQSSLLNGKRYFKFKIQLQLAGPPPAVAPATVTLMNLQFNGLRQNNFPLSPACGYLGSPGEGIFLISTFVVFALLTNSRRAKKSLWHRSTKIGPALGRS